MPTWYSAKENHFNHPQTKITTIVWHVVSQVFAGRPFLWGLTVGGEAGAQKILQIFKDELDLMMALTGNLTVFQLSYTA